MLLVPMLLLCLDGDPALIYIHSFFAFSRKEMRHVIASKDLLSLSVCKASQISTKLFQPFFASAFYTFSNIIHFLSMTLLQSVFLIFIIIIFNFIHYY